MKKITILLALSLQAVQAIAALPNTFVAGTPAKAAEVNQNFTYLDTKIDAVCNDQNGVRNTYTYTVNNLASGSVLNLTTAGQAIQYKMLTFPIYDHSTGKRYAVKIPYNSNISIGIYNTNVGCGGNETISGFPAVISGESEMQEIQRADNGSYSFTKTYMFPGVSIKIGSTRISLGLYVFESNVVANSTDNGTPFDLTDDITSGVQSTRMTASIAEIDAYIDYIVITEI